VAADPVFTKSGILATPEYLDLHLSEIESRIESNVRGWLITQTFAIIGSVGAMIVTDTAAFRLQSTRAMAIRCYRS
jgi:hypothetical protein